MYAKLQNGFLRSAPKTVQWQGHTVNNPSADKLAELGYKPVVYTDMPTDAPSGQALRIWMGRGRQDSSDVDTYGRPSLSRTGAVRRRST